MLEICLVFWTSEPQYACKRYAYKKHVIKDRHLIYSVTADVFHPYCSLSLYFLSNEFLKYFDFPSTNQE